MKRFTSALALAPLFLFPTFTISAQDPLPRDVNPESRNRLSLVKRESLDEKGKKAYDAAVAGFAGAPPAMGAEIRLHGERGGKQDTREVSGSTATRSGISSWRRLSVML